MKNAENMFEQFVYFIMPVMIVGIGLTGNLLGLIALKKKNGQESTDTKEIGPIYIYRSLFITDSIALVLSINLFFGLGHSTGPLLFSYISCKLFSFLYTVFGSSSSFFLIYILIESYLSITYPLEINLLRKRKPQLFYMTAVFIFNLIYFSPYFLN